MNDEQVNGDLSENLRRLEELSLTSPAMKVLIDKKGAMPLGLVRVAIWVSLTAFVACLCAITALVIHGASGGFLWLLLSSSFTATVFSRHYLQMLQANRYSKK